MGPSICLYLKQNITNLEVRKRVSAQNKNNNIQHADAINAFPSNQTLTILHNRLKNLQFFVKAHIYVCMYVNNKYSYTCILMYGNIACNHVVFLQIV